MAGEGSQVIAMRAILAPVLKQIISEYGRDWQVKAPAPTTVQPPTNSLVGGANKTRPGASYENTPIVGAAFQHDVTRDSTRVGSGGSAIEVPAYNFYCAYDQFNFSMPGFVLIDPETKLEYSPVGDAQEIGMVGLKVGWVLNLRAPNARGI